ncbi:MAG: phosphate acetyltransferase [Sulfuricurvum sp.]
MKTTALFVASTQENAGSILIMMGLMQLLKSKIDRVAFFRPIIEEEEDSAIRFMLEYFGLDQAYEASYGMRKHQLETLLGHNKVHEAIEAIMEKLTRLRENNRFVLIEGIAKSRLSSSIDGDINLILAKNLDSDFIAIINAKAKTVDAIVNEIKIESEAIKHQGVREFMMVVNRVDPDTIESLRTQSRDHPSLYCIPETPELDCITMGEVKEHLQCEWVLGDPNDWDKVIKTKLVAAMTSDHYLTRIRDKALVIVPADRSDIITSTILALYSRYFPNISGILLSGNVPLAPTIRRLLEGLESFGVPILSTAMDTYHATSKVDAIKAKITAHSERKIAVAMGLFYDTIDHQDFLKKLDTVATHHSMTPLMFKYTLFDKARKNKKTIVLPESEDERILRSAEIMLHQGVANIILLGKEEEIHRREALLGLDLAKATIIDPQSSPLREPFAHALYELRRHKGVRYDQAWDAMTNKTYFGTMLVHQGLADGMVSGATHTTADTIRPALQIIKTKPDISIVSSVFFMCLETEVLVYGDCAINPHPNAQELAQIAYSSAQTARAFGIEPRVAMLSYSTGTSGSGEEVEKVKEATHCARDLDPTLIIDGPLQYDAAIDPTVAALKRPDSVVAGHASVLIFPDLNTGNNTYKAVQRSSGAIAIGPVLQGLNRPINDLSRGCLVEDIITTIAITAIQAQEGN